MIRLNNWSCSSLLLLLVLFQSTHASKLPPFPYKHGLSKSISNRMASALESASLEQEVEDYNALGVAAATTPLERVESRRLICLPLDEGFDPPMGMFSHGHVQTGDKMSLPKCFYQAIQLSNAEVPWLFLVERVDNEEDSIGTRERVEVKEEYSAEQLDKVVGSTLDFRAPANYVFLPWWMMRALGLQARDVVQVSLIQSVPAGSAVQLRPHSSKFSTEIQNTQAVLETELKHYSSLTKGTTIAFDYNKQRYWFDVVDLRSAPRGEKVPMVKVQDCDVATDFVPAKDVMKKKKKQQRTEDE